MAEKLGILVCSDKHLDHAVGLTKAAVAKGKEVQVFFTGPGCQLTPKAEAKELMAAGAKVMLCDKTFQHYGLGDNIEGMEHGSQDENADMIEEVDRYVVF